MPLEKILFRNRTQWKKYLTTKDCATPLAGVSPEAFPCIGVVDTFEREEVGWGDTSRAFIAFVARDDFRAPKKKRPGRIVPWADVGVEPATEAQINAIKNLFKALHWEEPDLKTLLKDDATQHIIEAKREIEKIKESVKHYEAHGYFAEDDDFDDYDMMEF